ncbi:argininosuccinate lyase [Trichococcus shcherbakoviae]|uniref:Argininosuccinate lyase n=1 Tax=Trichococcus shcherbakoviae subsp. psychrophilus TaxID=2585775 RepID=A0A5C5EDB7_9LACT|nr:argininosuccinate lyase [Trichococcus shcherbakoviae]OUL09945.1 argininosuccinate lyase [Sedimentibacter sp. SX930]TNV70185.1 argininosuccinate lyase [Trichococcus shcherbakoviae subsp. psychrophilus]
MAIWSNNYHGSMNEKAFEFNSSIDADARLVYADIAGSIAHAKMLGKTEIIPREEADALVNELGKMNDELQDGDLTIDFSEEDIHSFLEAELTRRLGAIGKKVHTGRSRNDQVATALKLYSVSALEHLSSLTANVALALSEKAEQHLETIMPGYTHLQRAQPITFAHHLMAYTEMFLRDKSRLDDAKERVLHYMPLGSAALATTTLPLDRAFTAEALGFKDFSRNSLDGVSDRDHSLEMLSDMSIIMVHISRLAEEVIIWSSQEFGFVKIRDTFSSGSSIMPQKKNPDIAELLRGKSGRVFGDLMGVLTLMKGLPLAYNKDMQEEKELLFEAIDTVTFCLEILPAMLNDMDVMEAAMLKASQKGYLNATDCADYLVEKGIPFRDAYKITGNILKECEEQNLTLENFPLEMYKKHSDAFDETIYKKVDLKECVIRRNVAGGPAPERVKEHIEAVKTKLEDYQIIS